MPTIYKTMGTISSIAINQCKDTTKAVIEIDFMQGYKAEFKDNEDDANSKIYGIAQCIKLASTEARDIKLGDHKVIEKSFVISNALLKLAILAVEQKRHVVLKFTINNIVTELKVK